MLDGHVREDRGMRCPIEDLPVPDDEIEVWSRPRSHRRDSLLSCGCYCRYACGREHPQCRREEAG
jgi:hypothetical protein